MAELRIRTFLLPLPAAVGAAPPAPPVAQIVLPKAPHERLVTISTQVFSAANGYYRIATGSSVPYAVVSTVRGGAAGADTVDVGEIGADVPIQIQVPAGVELWAAARNPEAIPPLATLHLSIYATEIDSNIAALDRLADRIVKGIGEALARALKR